MGDKNIIHIASTPKNTGIYSVFASLYNLPCKVVEQGTLSQGSMPFATMPKTLVFTPKTLVFIYSMSAALYNILQKDVEQEKHSQASLPLATMPKTLVFTVFLFL